MTEIVEVTMKKHTLDQVHQLQKKIGAQTRADAIRRAIEISQAVVSAVERGDKVYIISKDGRMQKQILISGLNK